MNNFLLNPILHLAAKTKEYTMSKTAKFSLLMVFVLQLLAVQAISGESINVVSSVEELQSPIMHCVQHGSASTDLKINIQGISDTPVDIGNQAFNNIDLAPAEKLTVGQTSIDGQPELPLYTTMLAIPNYADISIRINSSSYEIIENYDIAPVQEPTPEGSEPIINNMLINEDVYNTDAFYPGDVVTVGQPMIMRDFRTASITVAPVQYNPVTRQLKVYTDIDFEVVYGGSNPSNPAPVSREYISDAFKPLYKAMFANYDEICSSIPSKRGGYLIITHDIFADSIKNFAEWKHQKGYDVTVFKLSDIGSNPSAGRIYNFIDSCYVNMEIPPEYVLLVGDVTMPNNRNFPDYPYQGYTSDHEYACVDGNDYLPDILISRWAVDTDREIHWVKRKTMVYEQGPQQISDGWLLRGLSVAGNMYAFTPRLTTLWVRQKLFEYGYTQCDTCYDWSESGHVQCNESVITNAFNAGVNFCAYRGWAGPSGWYNPSYSVSNLSSLSNEYRGGIMTSIVCGTGDFDDYTDPCFGEAWIRGGSALTPVGITL
jgi:hypothetical protein